MAVTEAVTRTAIITVACPVCGDPYKVGVEFDRCYSHGRYTNDILMSAIPDDYRHNRCGVGEADVLEAARAGLAAITVRVRSADALRRADRTRWR